MFQNKVTLKNAEKGASDKIMNHNLYPSYHSVLNNDFSATVEAPDMRCFEAITRYHATQKARSVIAVFIYSYSSY